MSPFPPKNLIQSLLFFGLSRHQACFILVETTVHCMAYSYQQLTMQQRAQTLVGRPIQERDRFPQVHFFHDTHSIAAMTPHYGPGWPTNRPAWHHVKKLLKELGNYKKC